MRSQIGLVIITAHLLLANALDEMPNGEGNTLQEKFLLTLPVGSRTEHTGMIEKATSCFVLFGHIRI